ncbi:hypothetical protein CR513_09738, partial [Mucuna pruriens]
MNAGISACARMLLMRYYYCHFYDATVFVFNSINSNPVQGPHFSSQSMSTLGILIAIAIGSSFTIPRNYAIATSSTSASQSQTCTSSIERNTIAASCTTVKEGKREQDNGYNEDM